ncbi:MAG: sigma-70 family RNA polymerase sigma factor [Vallitalea sp.]|jgi:RNA polymerase sigma-70 factor (ECF subfamily)|nr:sigma-70 family RNA polymerase sigma factor [Vallitalea sp.]
MSDEEIIELFHKRSEKAIQETKLKYQGYCFRIAQNIVSNEQDAHECINDTYLRIWNSIPPHRPSCLRAFISRIVRNIAIDRYRKMTALKRSGTELSLVFDELEETIPSSETPETKYEEGFMKKAISEFLHSLSKEHRIIFVRRYYYSDSIKVIAESFNVSESKVKFILYRLRKKLKKHLMREGVLYE